MEINTDPPLPTPQREQAEAVYSKLALDGGRPSSLALGRASKSGRQRPSGVRVENTFIHTLRFCEWGVQIRLTKDRLIGEKACKFYLVLKFVHGMGGKHS